MKAFLEVAVGAGSLGTATAISAASQTAEVRLAATDQDAAKWVTLAENGHIKQFTARQLEEMAARRQIDKHILPIAELLTLAEKSPPHQSWYDEEDLPF